MPLLKSLLNSEANMETQSENSTHRLLVISIVLGVISISPLVISVAGTALEGIFQTLFYWLHDFLSWLAATKIVVYIGWLSLPGLVTGIFAFKAGMTKREKGTALIGIILGVQGIAWTLLISSAIRLASYL
jgi:uncharacterized membrane protein